MATIFDCSDNSELLTGMRLARVALGRGELVVFPTDTVYGIAADAFSPAAVQRLLDAKGRTRAAPVAVLVPSVATLDALAEEVHDDVRALVDAFWPGGLTVIVPARSSLAWDLGETGGTVGLRMPDDALALELLAETGPLAVSSANISGEPAAMSAVEAERMLGDSVAVYLERGASGVSGAAARDGGDASASTAATGSTIVDATRLGEPGGTVTIVRHGAIPDEKIFEVLARSAPSTESPS
ncbi:L-threonylcarbamoyladenylate synthase [Marisediminicola sp. LYQ134]|uniref:L-threonylcarbamoyladenylate synthase n=1 Tax=unclassified Marisediminicola TaxID=2618316 RepID=UPI003982E12C